MRYQLRYVRVWAMQPRWCEGRNLLVTHRAVMMIGVHHDSCSIDGCGRRVKSRGWCSAHYERWRTTGDPQAPFVSSVDRRDRHFDARTLRQAWPETSRACVEWTGAVGSDGYGLYAMGRVHRIVFEALAGFAPEVVRHRCDNPRCYRFEHLEPGTHADNVADRVARGRSAAGERNRGGRRRRVEAAHAA